MCLKGGRFSTYMLGDRSPRRRGYMTVSKDDAHLGRDPALAGGGSDDTLDDGRLHQDSLKQNFLHRDE